MSDNHTVYVFAEFHLNPLEQKLYQGSEEIPLEAKEFDVLNLLVKNAGSTVKNEFILAEVWGEMFVEESAITVRISNLRRKLDNIDRKRFIKTEKKGYRFIVEVEIVQSPRNSLISEQLAEKSEQFDDEVQTVREQDNSRSSIHFSPEEFSNHASNPLSIFYRKLRSKPIIIFSIISGLIFILGFFLLGYLPSQLNSKKPHVEKASFVTEPVPNNQFFIEVTGKNLNPNTVNLKVTGPGCSGDAPCTVFNGPLRLFGEISESTIEKAPLTLAAGKYYIWLENDVENASNKIEIVVPQTNQK